MVKNLYNQHQHGTLYKVAVEWHRQCDCSEDYSDTLPCFGLNSLCFEYLLDFQSLCLSTSK